MSARERIDAMRAGRLSLRECLHWASQRPAEVPLLNGEFEFLAITTPEIAGDFDPKPLHTAEAAAAHVMASRLERPHPTPA